MAEYLPLDPGDPGGGGGGTPGTPGYYPPPDPGTGLALVVTGSSVTITSDVIAAAGGPWTAFTVRVTPINDKGAGTPAEVAYP